MISRFLLTLWVVLTLAPPAPAARPPMHWEKMRVYHAAPSVIFSRLGLTRMTRLGYTRDGAKKGAPDPKFPPNVLDVVPVDGDKMLLVRGTDNGLTQLRQRVAAADVAAVRWRLNVALLEMRDGREQVKFEKTVDEAEMDVPTVVTLSDGVDAPAYQLKVHDNFDGSATVSCANGVPLPAPPSEAGQEVAAVYVPTLAWTMPQTRIVKTGDLTKAVDDAKRGEAAAIFSDREADRRATREKLAASGACPSGDFTLRVTLTPLPSPP